MIFEGNRVPDHPPVEVRRSHLRVQLNCESLVLDADVSAQSGLVITVRRVTGTRRDRRLRTAECVGVDQGRGLSPGSPSSDQPAFEKVGMNR